MARVADILCGIVCVGLLGCGKTDIQPTAGTASNPADSAATSGVEALPDLQPVPAMADADQIAPTNVNARRVFDRWVAAAAANDPAAWTEAEQEMQALGATAVPALVAVLEEGQSLAREMAVMFLAQLGPQAEPAAAALAELLDDESALIRVNAAGVLTTFDGAPDSVVTTLTALLSDADPNIRTTAAGCLGNIAELSPTAIQRLIANLDDPEPRVRAASANTLSRSGTKASSALLKLRQLTADDDEAVRQAATIAARLVDPRQRPANSETVPARATDAPGNAAPELKLPVE